MCSKSLPINVMAMFPIQATISACKTSPLFAIINCKVLDVNHLGTCACIEGAVLYKPTDTFFLGGMQTL